MEAPLAVMTTHHRATGSPSSVRRHRRSWRRTGSCPRRPPAPSRS